MTDQEFAKVCDMSTLLEGLSQVLLGRSRALAIAGNSCVACGGRADMFKDDLSKREYRISGFCQTCQDSVFSGKPKNNS